MTGPWRAGDPDPCPVLADDRGYCSAPAYHQPGLPFDVVARCCWATDGHDPAWHVAADVSGRVIAVWPVGAPLPAGRALSPADDPARRGDPAEGDDARTDRFSREGSALGINRQCSIGWHAECSDPDGATCMCACHALPAGGAA